ncbi:uncharacterized protein LOC133306859 [Gastrolobium bilobum]|uniref:uncharacterized protein LOC133306859 n=1 Tax=Gastrolobium bilobum TaxID=150636 RepID=UPI002AB0A172|nr:uncharacterized protein LOC133306859 [Gastrolobium bilobum]
MSPPQDHSAGNISFSWEKKPGVSKVTTHGENLIPSTENKILPNLPPPPCTTESAIAKTPVHDFQIPLPPCAFQPPFYRTSSKRGLFVQDNDPFLAAYKECTKNQGSAKMNTELPKAGVASRLRKSLSFFSCKRSCNVRDNNLVRISHLSQT